MVSRKHQQYLDQARQRGYSTEQADEALERVRTDPSAEGGYVTDLYERALMRLDMGDPTAQGRVDAEQILADRGMGQVPSEVRDAMAQLLDRMGMTVDDQGRPAQAFPQVSANSLDGLSADLAGEMAEPEEQRAEQICPWVLQVLAERPGQWLVMAQIGQAAQIGPEEGVTLRMALESLSQAGHIEQGPEEYGQGPTWRARPQKQQEQEEEQLPGSQVRKGHRPASLSCHTFVLPPAVSQLDYQVPFLVLAVSRAEDLAHVPLPTSLHHMNNEEVLPLARADMLIEEVGPIPVTEEWMDAVDEFDDCVRVVVLCEPAPTHVDEEATSLTEALLGQVPLWAGALVAGKIRAVTRQVPMTRGQDPLSIGMDPSAPTTLSRWAHQTITPETL